MQATDFADPAVVRRLQARVADGDLANRAIPPEPPVQPAAPQCSCGNLLTIADRWGTCRDCRGAS